MNTRRKEDEIRDLYLQTGVFKKKNHTRKTFSDFFSLSYKKGRSVQLHLKAKIFPRPLQAKAFLLPQLISHKASLHIPLLSLILKRGAPTLEFRSSATPNWRKPLTILTAQENLEKEALALFIMVRK